MYSAAETGNHTRSSLLVLIPYDMNIYNTYIYVYSTTIIKISSLYLRFPQSDWTEPETDVWIVKKKKHVYNFHDICFDYNTYAV